MLCERKIYPATLAYKTNVREKPPQRVVCVSSHREGAFYFSQKNTEEQNTQGFTETLSQPISQNVTATFSWNVLWILYAGGVLWARNSTPKRSVKSVSSVREKPHQRFVCVLSHRERTFFFSQKNTEQDDVRTAHISNFSSQSDRIDKLPISRRKPSDGN